MKDHFYILTITCETQEQADEVIVERIGPEEDYGFEYSIDWKFSHMDELDELDCKYCGSVLLWDSLEKMIYCPNTWEHG